MSSMSDDGGGQQAMNSLDVGLKNAERMPDCRVDENTDDDVAYVDRGTAAML